jgi:hypothetical protein
MEEPVMKRRNFLAGLAVPMAAAAQPRTGGRAEGSAEPVAGPKPAIALSHVGFVPDARKSIIYRVTGSAAPTEFTLRELGYPLKSFQVTLPLKKVTGDLGDHLVGNFSSLDREGLFVATAGGERSVPFFIRKDAWRRTLPIALSYHHAQRCGVAIPNVHPACHLDDAQRQDTGQHVDMTGGWHDAGDVRKWMDATMLAAIGLLQIARYLGAEWDLAGSGLAPLVDEVKWGNRYFRKMQDASGTVWADTGGGVNGDNSDNHWTDNRVGSLDDRHILTRRLGHVQPLFILLQALVAQLFREIDPGYGQECMAAARRCWEAEKPDGRTLDLGWWTMAALEMDRAMPSDTYKSAAQKFARELMALQNTEFVGSQKRIRGFWRTAPNDPAPYKSWYQPTPAPQALVEMALAHPNDADAARWRDSVRLYLDEYVVPLCGRSVYGVMPVGVFLASDKDNVYRPLGDGLFYRYFGAVRNGEGWSGGLSSHVMGHAVLLARAAEAFREPKYRDLAYRQLEWIIGANPFGASLMTGVGHRNPYPFSVFAGLLPGGIMNGIAGNSRDEAVLSYDNGSDWRTCEYWSPHSCYYEWAVSLLERTRPL